MGKKQEEENGEENRNENSREVCTLGGPLGMGRPSVPWEAMRTDEAGRRSISAPGTSGPLQRPRSKGEPDLLPVGDDPGGFRARPSVRSSAIFRAWGPFV